MLWFVVSPTVLCGEWGIPYSCVEGANKVTALDGHPLLQVKVNFIETSLILLFLVLKGFDQKDVSFNLVDSPWASPCSTVFMAL